MTHIRGKESVTKIEDDDDEDSDEDEGTNLRKIFGTWAKYKDQNGLGTHILLSQSDIWMKQAGLIKGRKLTTTDTGICFFKLKKYKLNYTEYIEFLRILADYKKIPVDEIIRKLIDCGNAA